MSWPVPPPPIAQNVTLRAQPVGNIAAVPLTTVALDQVAPSHVAALPMLPPTTHAVGELQPIEYGIPENEIDAAADQVAPSHVDTSSPLLSARQYVGVAHDRDWTLLVKPDGVTAALHVLPS